MKYFNGAATVIRYNYGSGPMVWTDACATGYGIYTVNDWQAGLFNSNQPLYSITDCHQHWVNINKPLVQPKDDYINFWEKIAAWQAVFLVAHNCKNQHLVIVSDNTQEIKALIYHV